MGLFAHFRGLPRITGARSLATWLVVAFIFAVPWENALHIPQIGRISKAAGFVAALVWVISVIARGRLRHPDAFQKAFFLFLIWNGLTVYWTIDSGATMSGFKTYTELFLLLLMIWDLFDSEGVVVAGLQAYVFGAFITSGSVILNFVTEPRAQFEAHERINALGYETDGIALVIAIAAPAAWYLATGPAAHGAPALTRIVNYGYVPFGMLALVMTGTRGATLASIPTAIFVLWSLLHTRGRSRMVAVAALVVAVVMVIQFAPRGPLARIGTATTVTQVDEGALSGRWGIWMLSSRLLLDNPLTGVGLDAHRTAVAPDITQESAYKTSTKEAHNTYLSILAETGFVGFLLFVVVVASVVMRIRQRLGRDALYWFAQVGVLAIGGMSLSLEDSKSIWIFLSLAVASAAAARPATAAERVPATAASAPASRPPLGLVSRPR